MSFVELLSFDRFPDQLGGFTYVMSPTMWMLRPD